jgi:hypothetical protein
MDRRERIFFDEKTKKYCIEQRENGELVAIHFYDSISEELMPLVRYIPIAPSTPITPADNHANQARQSVQTSGASNKEYENEDSLGEFVITDRTVWVGVTLVSLVILATAAPMIIQTLTHIADLSIVMAEKAVEAVLALLKLIGYLIAAGLVLFFLYMVVKLWLSDKPPPPPAKATDKTRVTVVVGVEVDKL